MIAVNINTWPASWREAWVVAQRDINQEQLAAMLDLAAEMWPGNTIATLPSSLQDLGIDEALFELLKPVLSAAQLQASCSLNYVACLKLLDSSAKEIRLVGNLPSRIFRCINDLPPLSTAFVNL
ncbi:hypothetical protein EST38_g12027 [Candolleomyces aberdarensis]|uniref:Uncharacterized protein n=1 Tax=Candolleomyces aberdarensis TaxID=2316362 RepID=A0A4Q2D5P6_9AGAR|nr:hypothetical protein EST38_g12027 [Candolleomyces aberdarensis]